MVEMVEENWVTRKGERVTIRPIRPDDAEREQAFIRGLSSESRYFRFISAKEQLTSEALHRFTHIDPAKETALVVTCARGAQDVQVAVARFVVGPTPDRCEFAIVVADEWQGHGIGTKLMNLLLAEARSRAIRVMEGFVLATNLKMLALAKSLGFESHPDPDDPRMRIVRKPLDPVAS